MSSPFHRVVGSTASSSFGVPKPRSAEGTEHSTSQLAEVDLSKHPSGIIPQLQNVVATCYLGRKLDLKHIAMHARNAEYNPKRFAAVIMRIREPKTTALVFSSGKMVCTGAKSEQDVRLASRKFARIIQKLGFDDAKFRDFKVQNIVGSCDAKFPIRLEGLHLKHSMFSSYEPELFPGLIYRMKVPKVVLLIFVSGKVVLTGAKTREEIYEAFEKIYPSLVEFRKREATTTAPGLDTSSVHPHTTLTQKEELSEMRSFQSIMSNVNSLQTIDELSHSHLARSLGGDGMSYGDPMASQHENQRKRMRLDSLTLQGNGSLEMMPSVSYSSQIPPATTPRSSQPSASP